MIEEWKPIKNYEGLYEVSSLGRIKSLRTGRLMSPAPDSDGYATVSLFKSRRKTYRWHRLVLGAFVENLEEKSHVNHKNGNKLDNKLGNLEWATPSENAIHAHRIGLKNQKGEKNNSSKLTREDISKIRRRLGTGEYQYVIAKDFNISQPTVCLIKARKIWNY